MNRRFTPQFLRSLRNDVDINRVIEQILDWPCKTADGHFRFLCPRCREFNSATNPQTNLARCFCCHTNFNPIDFVIAVDQCSFVDAVECLRPHLTHSTRTTDESAHDEHLNQNHRVKVSRKNRVK